MLTALKNYCYFFWQRQLNPIDPFGRQFKKAIKCGVAAIVAMLLAALFQVGILWLVLTSVLVSYCYEGLTPLRRFIIQFLCGFFIAVGCVSASLLTQHFIIYLVLIFIMALLAFYIGRWGVTVGLPAILVLFQTFLGYSYPLAVTQAINTFFTILCGTLIAIIIAHTLWPYEPKRQLTENFDLASKQLNKYLKFILQDMLRGNYHHHYYYKFKLRVLNTLQSNQELLALYPAEHLSKLLPLQQQLFAEICLLGDVLSHVDKAASLYFVEKVVAGFLNQLPDDFAEFTQLQQQMILSILQQTIDYRYQTVAGMIHEDVICLDYLLRKIVDKISAIATLLKPNPVLAWSHSA